MFRKLGLVRVVPVNSMPCPPTRSYSSAGFVEYRKTWPEEPGYVRRSPYADVQIPNLTVDKYVWQNVKQWEKKVATV